ncbi:MAG: carbamoyl-phosphate synthase domain-containing protein, partial [Methanosarcinales archaeon]
MVKQLCRNPSNWRSEKNLEEFLLEYNILAIGGVDTRLLTIKIRIHGTVQSRLVVYEEKKPDVKELIQKTREQKDITEIELV